MAHESTSEQVCEAARTSARGQKCMQRSQQTHMQPDEGPLLPPASQPSLRPSVVASSRISWMESTESSRKLRIASRTVVQLVVVVRQRRRQCPGSGSCEAPRGGGVGMRVSEVGRGALARRRGLRGRALRQGPCVRSAGKCAGCWKVRQGKPMRAPPGGAHLHLLPRRGAPGRSPSRCGCGSARTSHVSSARTRVSSRPTSAPSHLWSRLVR